MMIERRNTVLLLIISLLLMHNVCAADEILDSNIVVVYDTNRSITIKDLNKYIEDWLYYKKFKNRSEIYNNALNDMLVNQFKRMDFFEKGLDKDTKLIQSINRIINEELVAEYYETQYLGKYANEERAKEVYGIMDIEVVYQSIELTKPENASGKQLDSLQEKALAIKSEIDNGKDFTSLVKKYSQNKNSLINNGYMPAINWKQSISDPGIGAIFNLNKNDIRVLNSDHAFMIVKISDIKKVYVAPFDSIKSEIISELKSSYASTSLDDYEKDKKDLVDENSLKWNNLAFGQIVQWSGIRNFYKGEYKKIFNDALATGDNKIILTYNDNSTLDYKEYLRLLDNILVMENTNNLTEDDLKKFILEAIRTDLIVKKADSLKLRKNIFNAFTNNAVLKSQIVHLYDQSEVEGKIPEVTDAVLLKFFKDNENTLYYQLEKRNIFVMIFRDEDEAEKASEMVKGGKPFEKVTGNYLVKTYLKEKDGVIKSYLNDEEPIYKGTVFDMNESEVSEPIKFQDENNLIRYAIIKCHHIRPEKQLTYNDVKDIIIEDYKNYQRRIILMNIEEKLITKYHPVINEEIMAKLISRN